MGTKNSVVENKISMAEKLEKVSDSIIPELTDERLDFDFLRWHKVIPC
jgi:hypothetical protein